MRGKLYGPKVEKRIMPCETSSIATNVFLEAWSFKTEDAGLLRKKSDTTHINDTELKALARSDSEMKTTGHQN